MKRYTVDDVERLFRSDVTADEINSLFRAAANGDEAAIKRIDKYCRELWRDHPDLAAEFDMPKSCAEALETSKKLKAKITATIDDPISRIIHARLEQIRQNNDPVLSAILDMDGQEFRQAVYKRMGQPVALPPQNTPKLPLDKALDYLEEKILAAVTLRREAGEPTGDEYIAGLLPTNSRGKCYTREWVNKKRNAMRKRGIDV